MKPKRIKKTPEPGIVVVDQNGFEMVYVPTSTVQIGVSQEGFKQLLEQGAFAPFVDVSQIDSIIRNHEAQGIFDTIEISLPGFWIDKYEVTVDQYHTIFGLCIESRRCASVNLQDEFIADSNQPQVGVNWFDALRFCNARNARLPTEYEWEYAASGPENLVFPWGNSLVEENISVALLTGVVRTYPVGSKPNNESWIGAYDMAGNAAEWVEGRMTRYDITKESLFWWRNQPFFDVFRVKRGGSYSTSPFFATTFARDSGDPQIGDDTGVRCARSTDPRE